MLKRSYNVDIEYNKIISRYIDYGNNFKPNKKNVECLRLVNDCIDKLVSLINIFKVLLIYFKENKNIKICIKYSNMLYNIHKSFCRQYGLYYKIKYQLKQTGVTDDEYKSIIKSSEHLNERIYRIKNSILLEYIAITPLYDRSLFLESKGLNLYDELYNLPLSIEESLINIANQNKTCALDYIDLVLKENTTSHYINNQLKAYDDYKSHAEEVKRAKHEDALENKKKRAEDMQEKLYKDLNLYMNNYEKGIVAAKFNSDKWLHTTKSFRQRLADFKDINRVDSVKIIAIEKVRAGSRSKLKFYSNIKYNDEMLTETIFNSKFFCIDDKLPEDIQKAIDEYDVVYAEYII